MKKLESLTESFLERLRLESVSANESNGQFIEDLKYVLSEVEVELQAAKESSSK